MKKLNFLAILLSGLMIVACGEQRQNDETYETAPERTEQSPSDVYEDDAEFNEEYENENLNMNREGEIERREDEFGVEDEGIENEGAEIETREQEDTVNTTNQY